MIRSKKQYLDMVLLCIPRQTRLVKFDRELSGLVWFGMIWFGVDQFGFLWLSLAWCG